MNTVDELAAAFLQDHTTYMQIDGVGYRALVALLANERARADAARSLLRDIADNDRAMAILERFAQPTWALLRKELEG